MTKAKIEDIEPDFIHSSNTVFSFMKEAEYLEKAILNKCISPRYCEENIEYLNLQNEGNKIRTIAVLQKCFCDIPLHRITRQFPLKILSGEDKLDEKEFRQLKEGSTHTDFYGEYGIAFSKSWAQGNNLQPVQYINQKATLAEQFKDTFEFVLNQDDIDDVVVSDIISRLAYFKPLFGEMPRTIGEKKIRVLKNFCDECEWRFVPKYEELVKYNITSVIFDEEMKKISNQISNRLEDDKYKELSLKFEFQDIRYLIVPNNAARIKLIEYIMSLELGTNDENQEKYLLISKILVLTDIKKDF